MSPLKNGATREIWFDRWSVVIVFTILLVVPLIVGTWFTIHPLPPDPGL